MDLLDTPIVSQREITGPISLCVAAFYDFTTDDITITDYKKNPQIKNIPIAI